jgi:uncharacterized protein (DUF885 family)
MVTHDQNIRTQMTKWVALLGLLSVMLGFISLKANAETSSGAQAMALAKFNQLVDEYFAFYFSIRPSEGTQAGLHEYDMKMEDFSPAAVGKEITGLEGYNDKFGQIEGSQLPEIAAGDLAMLLGSVRSQLLDLKNIQRWRKDPDLYSSVVCNSAFVIMRRNFAPAEDRLRSLIARERRVPALLQAARQNLKNPPRVYTEVALQQLPDDIEFFRKDVPEVFSSVKDAKLMAEFKAANGGVIEAMTAYQTFLRQDVLPASHGDFQLGVDNYREKLRDDEMVDIPLEQLLEIGYADLRRNQRRIQEVAAQIDSKRTLAEVLSQLRKDHPASGQLLQSFRDVLGGLREYIVAKNIITIPSEVPPIVEQTPPFERALTTASMDTPGAYETRATEALMNVTTADPNWTQEHTEQWLQSFNRGTIISTAIHEVYPGHYVQFLWIKRAPSKTRKLLFSGSNAEGWAHYTEQMMLDEGYGNGDLTLRMGQLQDALLRDARFIAGIEMHTGKMTLDQAREFFIKEGYQVPPVADEESKRGTSDPTYLVYTLGKLQIMKLREDYKAKMGDKFTLREFHDRFMEQGSVPLKIIRKNMLGDDSPTLSTR